jgi:Anti-sigma factor NepR
MDRPTASKARRASARAPLTLIPYTEAPYSDLALRDPSLPTPTLDRTAQDRIGRQLRAMYADLERQPIPQRLLDLVGKLAEPKD